VRRGGRSVRGVPNHTVRCEETPTVYGRPRVCSVLRSRVQSPNSASTTTAVTVIPKARTCRSNVKAWRHFSWNTTAGGVWPRARCADVKHGVGR